MAIKNCDECGAAISDIAYECVHCGAATKTYALAMLVASAVTLGCGWWIYSLF